VLPSVCFTPTNVAIELKLDLTSQFQNNERRRTPGGVFLYLIRNNQGLLQSARDEIFEYDRKAALEAKRTDKGYQMKMMLESITSSAFGGTASNLDVKINGEGNGKLEIRSCMPSAFAVLALML